MSTINEIVNWLQIAIGVGLALRILIISVKIITNEEEKSQNIRRLKHCVIAGVLTVTIVSIRYLLQSYFR